MGNLLTIDADAWFLPDTTGITYHAEHQKTTLAAQMIDLDERRLGYFHNAAYYELDGDDFDGLFGIGAYERPDVLPPYVETIRFAGGHDLGERSRARPTSPRRSSRSPTRTSRAPTTNPLARMKKQIQSDVSWLAGSDLATFHRYAFGTCRQCGANAELAAAFVGWLDAHDGGGLSDAIEGLLAIATGCKALEFGLARRARPQPRPRCTVRGHGGPVGLRDDRAHAALWTVTCSRAPRGSAARRDPVSRATPPTSPRGRSIGSPRPFPAPPRQRCAAGRTDVSGRDYDSEDWWFRCRFAPDDPAASATSDWVLDVEGLATIADVWLNGEHLLHSENMFVAHAIDVPALAAENELVIRCAALAPLLEQRRPAAALEDVPRLEPAPALVPHHAPRPLARMGPHAGDRRPVAPGAHHREPGARDHPTGRRALRRRRRHRRTVTAAARAAHRRDDGRRPGRRRVGRDAGHARWRRSPRRRRGPRAVGGALVAAHARRPAALRPLGRRAVNSASSSVGSGSAPSTSIAPTGASRSSVNGVPVFCRGACWLPPDPVTMAASADVVRSTLELARAAHMNMVRVAGTTVYPDPAFWDACDELGILVWQDCMFAFMDPPDDDDFVEGVRHELTQNLGALGGRPVARARLRQPGGRGDPGDDGPAARALDLPLLREDDPGDRRRPAPRHPVRDVEPDRRRPAVPDGHRREPVLRRRRLPAHDRRRPARPRALRGRVPRVRDAAGTDDGRRGVRRRDARRARSRVEARRAPRRGSVVGHGRRARLLRARAVRRRPAARALHRSRARARPRARRERRADGAGLHRVEAAGLGLRRRSRARAARPARRRGLGRHRFRRVAEGSVLRAAGRDAADRGARHRRGPQRAARPPRERHRDRVRRIAALRAVRARRTFRRRGLPRDRDPGAREPHGRPRRALRRLPRHQLRVPVLAARARRRGRDPHRSRRRGRERGDPPPARPGAPARSRHRAERHRAARPTPGPRERGRSR